MVNTFARIANYERTTGETRVTVALSLDGTGEAQIASGIAFLDHLIAQLAKHGRFDIELGCAGDLEIDDHHSAEDCALALGAAFDRALGERVGIRRFGDALAPLDEALARAVVDFSGRPHAEVALGLEREMLGTLATENVEHFVRSFAMGANACVHLDVLKGRNDHHRAESAFKALALALRSAVARDGSQILPSTKGVLG